MNRSRLVHYAFAISLGVAFPPFLIILHELGHYLAASAWGYAPTLSYGEVRYSRPNPDPNHIDCAIATAGPLVEVTLACIGVAGLARARRRLPSMTAWELWTWTVLAGAGLRWFKVLAQGPQSDEASISVHFGQPYYVLPLVLFPASLGIVWLLVDTHRRAHSLRPLAVGAVVGILSLIFWFTCLGPALLPRS
jgi:hypothetical protein